MAAEPRLYRYDDPGAPQPDNVQDAFYQVTKAVLVDGYGSHPAAGWQMVYDTWLTNGLATFTNAARSGILGAVRGPSSSNPCALFIADAMVDATMAVNARSGYNAVTDLINLPNMTNRTGVLYNNKHKYWAAIANENVAIIWFASSATYLFSSSSSISWSHMDAVLFGSTRHLRGLGGISNPVIGNFCLSGGWLNDYSTVGFGRNTGVLVMDEQGAPTTGTRYGFNWPFYETSRLYGINSPDSIVELDLRPMEIWTSQSTSTSYAYQQCRLPMVLSSPTLTGSTPHKVTDRISTQPLSELVTVPGRTGHLAVLPMNQRAVISMALEDWT